MPRSSRVLNGKSLPESIFDWTEADLEKWLKEVWEKRRAEAAELSREPGVGGQIGSKVDAS